MEAQKKPSEVIIITETKWLGRHCIKARQEVNRQTGKTSTEFKRWVNGRYIPAQKKLMPGYWTDVRFYELDLLDKVRQAFAHMIGEQGST